MSQRTTEAAVEKILGLNYDGSTDLDPFILTAVAVTDWLVSEDSQSVITTALAERIEAYLAAHYYGHHDQFKASEAIGRASANYQGQYGKFLESTRYGQTALQLDVSGNLAGMGTTIKISWLGLPPSDQTDYEDRD